jgi:RNA polymerase sigma-70 factor (ECF subfamily)
LDRAAAYAYAIVRNREDAEDAIQEAAIKGFLAFRSYNPFRPFRSWWFVIIRNCCRDLLRRKRTRGSPVDIEHSDVAVTPSPDADRREEMRNAFQQLSEAHREVLELRYYGECSYREIAAVLDVPEGTVMSRLYAARRALAAVYKRREE